MTVLRTMLFVPGNSWRMINKVRKLSPDAVILDLEDAVPASEKETARIFVRDAIDLLSGSRFAIFVRVNRLLTDLVTEDLEFAIQEGLDGIMLPKCEDANDIFKLDELIKDKEEKRGIEEGQISLIPLIETPKGVLKAYEIASARERVIAIAFGAVDFTRELGTTISKEGKEIFYARSFIAIAGRAAGIQAVDTVWTDIIDVDGLIEDSKIARRLGFRGKLVIHPNQIEHINKIFSPGEEEIGYAKKIVEAFTEAQARGLGAISVDDRMVDIADYRRAKELLSLVESIEGKGKAS